MNKLQVTLKNNKNAHKLYNTTQEIFQDYKPREIKSINQIIVANFKGTDGARNKRGKMFLNKKNKLNRVVAI